MFVVPNVFLLTIHVSLYFMYKKLCFHTFVLHSILSLNEFRYFSFKWYAWLIFSFYFYILWNMGGTSEMRPSTIEVLYKEYIYLHANFRFGKYFVENIFWLCIDGGKEIYIYFLFKNPTISSTALYLFQWNWIESSKQRKKNQLCK